MLISASNRLLYPSIISNRSYNEIIDALLGIRADPHVKFYNIMDNDDVMVIRILHKPLENEEILEAVINDFIVEDPS